MKIKTILWDFDGVILDSMKVRDEGFADIFKEFKDYQVKQLISYHRANGGLSRYVKIRHFFEHIIGRETTDEEIMEYASHFSTIMRKLLIDPKNLIIDSVNFIKENYQSYNFHIVSGSDQEELRFLCKQLEIQSYFLSIEGSPTHKNILVKNILDKYNYEINKVCLIGDSINDFDAAMANNICFFGYNNDNLQNNGNYITTLSKFDF